MIIGPCPYCEASQWNGYAGPGQMQHCECDTCHKTYWLRHSNIDPEAFTEESFAERFEVNEETKSIRDKVAEEAAAKDAQLRKERPEMAALIDRFHEEAARRVAADFEEAILYGTGPLAKSFAGPVDYHDGGLAALIDDSTR